MANRYARLDVDFLHKRTATKLTQELGIVAPLVFVALILRAKDSVPPGSFSYASEAIAWDKLGLDPTLVPFTLDEFLTVTGRLKQTSRTPVGRLMNVRLTRYGDWQQESDRYEEAMRKSRSRALSKPDTDRTPPGTATGHDPPSSTSTSSTSKRRPDNWAKPEPLPHAYQCPYCTVSSKTAEDLQVHVENIHQNVALGTIG